MDKHEQSSTVETVKTREQVEELGNHILARLRFQGETTFSLDRVGSDYGDVAQAMDRAGLCVASPGGYGYDNWGRPLIDVRLTSKGEHEDFACGPEDLAYIEGLRSGYKDGETRGRSWGRDESEYKSDPTLAGVVL